MTSRPATRRRGFALLSALALLVLTSVVALELSEAVRPRRFAAVSVSELAMAEAAARAGLEEARTRLLYAQMASMRRGRPDPLRERDPWAWMVSARLEPARAGDLRWEVTIEDAGATLQLNLATEDQLRRLLLALRVDDARADRAAEAILDWRDGDQLHRLRGAEAPQYLRAGAPLMPDDAPFRDVATLREVAGVGEPLYRLLRPYVRVVGGARVNLNTAPAPVLLALPGMSDQSVALLLRWRAERRRVTDLATLGAALPSQARARLLRAMPALTPLVETETREVLVTSIATRDGVERARAEALMVRDNGVTVGWRRMSP